MAFFFGDGFDLYAQPSDATASYWDPSSLNPNSSFLVVGRFSGSRGLNFSTSTRLDKVSSVLTDAVHHFVLAFMSSNITGSSPGIFMQLSDGATVQCSVVFRSDGAIVLTSGGPTGAALSIYTGAFTTNNVWYAFEIEVVVHNTSGSMTVRRNGNTNNDFYSGLLNTRASANNYANKLQFGCQSAGSQNIDDFLWRSDASTVPWVGDIRCYTRHPVLDVTVQLSRSSAPVNALMWSPVNVNQSLSAGTGLYMQFLATYSGLLTGVTFGPNSSGGTGHIKAAVFSVIGGVVGSVLAVSAEVTNPTSPGVTLTFPTPAYLTAGQTYWIGVIEDSGTIALNVVNAPAACLAVIISAATPYASWPISNPGGGFVTGNNLPGVTLIFTPQSNADAVGELQQDLAVNYVYSSTNGQADLYALGSVSAVPASVVGVTTRGFFEKTDAGTRNATVQLKSGGTTVQGVDTALNTVWGWIARTDVTDPATSTAWTASAVNSVNIGPKITA